MGHDDRTGFFFGEWFMVLNRLTLLEGLVRQPTKHRFYRAWVTIKPVGSVKSCRPKANQATKMLLRPTVQRNEPNERRILRKNISDGNYNFLDELELIAQGWRNSK
ncbi:hypothetical protein PIB30_048908 [Stylosanthes scabra]|uniref:Uncharacterized protein n=1 Tax=Stylosanthes scabra TaxID=79078 RepID=A0ABU6UGK5_9FABA|nr:hypothetical protein [Stylosanthes scabra]